VPSPPHNPPPDPSCRVQNNTLSIEGAPNTTFLLSSLSLASYNWFTINSSSVTLDNSRLNFSNYFTWCVCVGGGLLCEGQGSQVPAAPHASAVPATPGAAAVRPEW
jgi:hypothetical protein